MVSVVSLVKPKTIINGICCFSACRSWIRVMVFNATFNNISVITRQSVLLVEETGENHQPAVSH